VFLAGELRPQPLEEDRLVFRWLRDATASDINAAFGGKHDIERWVLRVYSQARAIEGY